MQRRPRRGSGGTAPPTARDLRPRRAPRGVFDSQAFALSAIERARSLSKGSLFWRPARRATQLARPADVRLGLIPSNPYSTCSGEGRRSYIGWTQARCSRRRCAPERHTKPSKRGGGAGPGAAAAARPVPHALHGRLAYSHGGGASAVLGGRPGRRQGRRTQNRRVGAQLFGSIAATNRVGPDDELGAVLPDTRGRPRPSTPPSLALLFAADVHKCSTTQEKAVKDKRASKHNFH